VGGKKKILKKKTKGNGAKSENNDPQYTENLNGDIGLTRSIKKIEGPRSDCIKRSQISNDEQWIVTGVTLGEKKKGSAGYRRLASDFQSGWKEKEGTNRWRKQGGRDERGGGLILREGKCGVARQDPELIRGGKGEK